MLIQRTFGVNTGYIVLGHHLEGKDTYISLRAGYEEGKRDKTRE